MGPSVTCEDNVGAIYLLNNLYVGSRTKNIDARDHELVKGTFDYDKLCGVEGNSGRSHDGERDDKLDKQQTGRLAEGILVCAALFI
jgi:hypothetical protein